MKPLRSMLLIAAITAAIASAQAGQFKTLDTASLPVNRELLIHSSPQNTGKAMEMETYEWQTAASGGQYRCAIVSNNTGSPLNVVLIGVNAISILGSCQTASNGACTTPAIPLEGNLKFQCLVATGNGFPVKAGAHYVMSVNRGSIGTPIKGSPRLIAAGVQAQ